MSSEESSHANLPPAPAPPSPELSSLNTLRLALGAMKDRCQRTQRRVDELEEENLQLRGSRGDLYREMKKLHDSNQRLREKNLQMNQKLHRKSRENVEVRDQLNSLQASRVTTTSNLLENINSFYFYCW